MSIILEVTPFYDGKTFSEARIQSYQQSFKNNSSESSAFLFAIYSLELLRSIQKNLVTPVHAYAHSRICYNVEKTDDRHIWNKYLNQYKSEIETNVATSVVNMIHDLAMSILTCPSTIMSAGIPLDMYRLIKRCEKKFEGFVNYPTYETLELSLKHLDITETDKSVREHKFTLHEVCEMFSEFLAECVRPIRDEKDLMDRSSKTAIKYFTTGLAIIYRLFSKTKDQYWYMWDQLYDNRYSYNKDGVDYVSTVPVRTPEFVICLDGKEKFSRKSLDAPVEINGVVDRYLYLLHDKL